METKYDNYVNLIKELEENISKAKREYKNKVQSDLIKELSKYFIHKKLSDIDMGGVNTGKLLDDVFLLNNEYGLILQVTEYDYDWFTISIKSIYKNLKYNKFIVTKTLVRYLPKNGEDVSMIAQDLYDRLKDMNVQRIKNKKKRAFKKQINKYNL